MTVDLIHSCSLLSIDIIYFFDSFAFKWSFMLIFKFRLIWLKRKNNKSYYRNSSLDRTIRIKWTV